MRGLRGASVSAWWKALTVNGRGGGSHPPWPIFSRPVPQWLCLLQCATVHPRWSVPFKAQMPSMPNKKRKKKKNVCLTWNYHNTPLPFHFFLILRLKSFFEFAKFVSFNEIGMILNSFEKVIWLINLPNLNNMLLS